MKSQPLESNVLGRVSPSLVLFVFNLLRFQLKKNLFFSDIIFPATKKWCSKISFLLKKKFLLKNYKKLLTFRFLGSKKLNNSLQILVIVKNTCISFGNL